MEVLFVNNYLWFEEPECNQKEYLERKKGIITETMWFTVSLSEQMNSFLKLCGLWYILENLTE